MTDRMPDRIFAACSTQEIIDLFTDAINDETPIPCAGTETDCRYPGMLKSAMAEAIRRFGGSTRYPS